MTITVIFEKFKNYSPTKIVFLFPKIENFKFPQASPFENWDPFDLILPETDI